MSSLPKLKTLPTLPAHKRPSALLLVADYHGTLACVRSLGRAGVDVTVADWRRMVPAVWSKFTKRSLKCPDPTSQPRETITWLLELGARQPGMVLIPTTDDIAWLYARHRAELQQFFVLDSPHVDAVYALLNKWKLREACKAVGIDTPDTWLPGEELDQTELRFPLLIKPQSQTLLYPHQKGRVVRNRSELKALYEEFRSETSYAGALLDADPNVKTPMLQALVESRGIYGLSGFIDASGELFVASAARKVLQKPQILGVGLCFQQAKLNEELAQKLRGLCRHVGYHGLFEVEFLEENGKFLLIDFNPRTYGQIAFDISRGADLPLMAYLHAIGDLRGLRAVVETAQKKLHHEKTRAWCDRISLELFLNLRRLTGKINGAQARTWTQWIRANERHLTDAMIDRDDWLPAIIGAISAIWAHAKHPRATWRLVKES